jgi:Tol biopolymer transport system component
MLSVRRRECRMTIPTDAWVQVGAATTPVFSKDGQTLFHLRGAGLPQVWAMALDGSAAKQLSFHDEKVAFLRRSPIDDTLIWGIDAGGDERQQFVILAPGGAPEQLTETPVIISAPGPPTAPTSLSPSTTGTRAPSTWC